MFITQCYKYEYNGIIYVGGNVPKGATILETMDILNAEEGFELVRISDGENVGTSVWLKDGDVMDNYEEVEVEDEQD
ncbi:MAG: hypothetical protein IJS26_05400 [Alphaproteobacteria bacterium]|nr:hypothetical protein [Alphaproteobacteria bacterium]